MVTGHHGYLGTVMVPILQAAGHDVTGLDSGFFADCMLGPAPQDPLGIPVDLRDVTCEQVNGFDAVIHLAALSNVPLGALAPQITYDINHHASVRLARLAKEAGVRRFSVRVHLLGVWGGGPGSRHRACSVATADPVRGEQGPGGGRCRGRVLLAGVSAQRHRIRVLAASARGHRAEQSRRSCRPHQRRSRSLGRHAVASGSKLLITGETGADPRSYRVDFSAFRRVLGFEAAWTIPDGAAELYKEYISAGLTADDFAKKFTRLPHLEGLRARGVLDYSMRRITTDA